VLKFVQFISIIALMKNFFISIISFILVLSFTSGAKAHSGRTDSSGGHNCNVGSCAGTYHYHNGGGSYGGYVPPKPVQLNMPIANLNYNFEPNKYGSFTVELDWDRPDGEQWSVGISKTKGADPGPLTDTTISKFTFRDIKSGTWYINIKEGMPNGYWSNVSYWTVIVPSWTEPTPTPTPFSTPVLTVQPKINETSSKSDSDSDFGTALVVGGLSLAGIYSWSKSKS
jgi:hypothetical protein